MSLKVISTVTSDPVSYDLTTLAVIKDELSIATGDTSNDATLSRYLSWASAALAQACDRVFPVETVRDDIYPERGSALLPGGLEVLQLSRWPLVSVTSVTEDGTALVADTDFVADKANGRLLRLTGSGGQVRSWPACNVSVVFVAGFATIPGDIADAVTRMVRNRFRSKGRDTYLISENIPGVRDARWWIATGNEAGNMPPDVADLVENYRMPVIA